MSNPAAKPRRTWKSAQLFVGFYRDLDGRARDTPHVWPPKNGRATLYPDPKVQETFIVLKSAGTERDQDIQIKLRPDMIVLRRDLKEAWQGVQIDEGTITVTVGDVMIRVRHDGSVTREDGATATWVEADGSVLKKTAIVTAAMSADGIELKRRTPDNVAVIAQDGMLFKDRSGRGLA